MKRAEREAVLRAIAEIRAMGAHAEVVVGKRRAIANDGRRSTEELESRWTALSTSKAPVRLLVVRPRKDADLAHRLLAHRTLRDLSVLEKNALTTRSPQTLDALERASEVSAVGRFFAGSGKRQVAEANAKWALVIQEQAATEGWAIALSALQQEVSQRAAPLPSHAGVIEEILGAAGAEACPIDREVMASAMAGHTAVRDVRFAAEDSAEQIKTVGASIRGRDVKAALREMSLDALKAATDGRIRLGILDKAGFESVQDVLTRSSEVHSVSGLGEKSAVQVVAAAEKMQSLVRRETPLRIDVVKRDKQTDALLRLLSKWATANASLRRHADLIESTQAFRGRLAAMTTEAGKSAHYIAASTSDDEIFMAELQRVSDLKSLSQDLKALPQSVWDDFLTRPSDYLGWLRQFGFQTAGDASSAGQLSKKLINKVRRQDLDSSRLRGLSLRGYQDFGARFALVQKKVVIGDEMGLGKTIEALAFLAHLHAEGASHTVVVCPAAVVSNWAREITQHSDIDVSVLHGQDKTSAATTWVRRGGIAVTTFETLPSLSEVWSQTDDLQAVVIDEAHFIKNPTARRTRLSRALIDRCPHALLLTGTPIENRLEEFENLISYLQPELVSGVGVYAPMAFPRLVAPAYLRRNQEDVLQELPERIDVDECLPMSSADFNEYAQAVHAGNFMAMRRAAMVSGQPSSKVQRLLEIVAEARANHRKVIIFSFFRDVLTAVLKQLDGEVYGPLNGSVPARERQRMVDAFTKDEPGAVLVSQITAGGVGLNIQAGSVVILCEPQVKPSMESQAIARAHRMGQTQTVQVHRLLSDQGVDKRMVEILLEKQQIFDEYARVSHTANTTPEAMDVTEVALATQIIAEERERLAREGSIRTTKGVST